MDSGVIRKRGAVCFLGEGQTDCRKIFAIIDDLLLNKFNAFIFSADTLFCLECARQVILRKKKQRGNTTDKIKLLGVIPFEDHINRRSENFRDEYFEVLENCDDVIVFDNKDSFIESDFSEFILNKSSILICPEKGSEYEKLYAQAMGIKIIGMS